MFIKAHTARLNHIIVLKADDIKTMIQAATGTTIETYNNDVYIVSESIAYLLKQIEGTDND